MVSVPDIATSEGLLRPFFAKKQPRLVRVCKEDEGVAIYGALSYCNRGALLLIQQTGLLNSINAIRGIAVEYSLPICMMVGLLRRGPACCRANPSATPCASSKPVLDAMGIAYHEIEGEGDVGKIARRSRRHAQMRPVVILIGRSSS